MAHHHTGADVEMSPTSPTPGPVGGEALAHTAGRRNPGWDGWCLVGAWLAAGSPSSAIIRFLPRSPGSCAGP
jgi:hypothetical protein